MYSLQAYHFNNLTLFQSSTQTIRLLEEAL